MNDRIQRKAAHHDLVIGGNFTSPGYTMISAQGDSMSREWLHIKGKKWDWLVLPNEEADIMLCYKDSGGTSRGFGGNTLKLKVIGELIKPAPIIAAGLHIDYEVNMFQEPREFCWQGPWSSNSRSLFEDTGYNLINRIKTWGCIGTDRIFGNNQNGIGNLIYFDEEPMYGLHSRIEDMAKALSDQMECVLYYYSESHGGSSLGPINFNKYGIKEKTT